MSQTTLCRQFMHLKVNISLKNEYVIKFQAARWRSGRITAKTVITSHVPAMTLATGVIVAVLVVLETIKRQQSNARAQLNSNPLNTIFLQEIGC